MRVLSIGIRKTHKKKELRAAREKEGGNQMEMAQDGNHGHYEVGDADGTGVEEYMIPDDDEKYAQWEEEENKMMAMMKPIDQENQDGNLMQEGMDAEPIGLEDFLGLMKVCPRAPPMRYPVFV